MVTTIEASPHDPGTAYLAATRYKLDDFAPYLFKTTDFGATWQKITSGIAGDDFTRVIREDPARKGFLYAGTETGIYLSSDDGATWQRLGGNFPVVPVHDMVLTQGDLVVGTHGRSFWVFDDVTVLHQLSDQADAKAEEAKLLTPRDTIRYGRLHGFGHSPVNGKNFAFVGGLIPAFYQKKDPDGQTKSTWIDAGTNPPDGILLHYTLAEEPAEPITLAFFDADGNEIRSFKSKKKDDEPAATTVSSRIHRRPARRPDRRRRQR